MEDEPSSRLERPPAPRRPSPRSRLAGIALAAALGMDEVVAGHSGPSGAAVTVVDGTAVAGVLAAARPDGRFDVALHLIVRPAALRALAGRVRSRVATAAARDGLGEILADVNISFEDVLEVTPVPDSVG